MAPPSSSSPLPPHRSHLFTPIQEGNESEETEERHRFGGSATATPSTTDTNHYQRTPLHVPPGTRKTTTTTNNNKSRRSDADVENDRSVNCTNCRPTPREKTSVVVVPVDPKHHSHSHFLSFSSTPGSTHGGGLFKSLISGISRRSPKPSPLPESSSSSSITDREEQWRIAVAELSHKLVQANRRRDEAILESSKLKYSMAELEKKLNRLEVYCHSLKSGLEICGYTKTNPNNNNSPARNSIHFKVNNHDVIIKNFLVSVSDARSSIRYLSRSLTSQLKLMGIKVFERLSSALRSYDIKISSNNNNNNQRTVRLYLEALLNSAFFEDFESADFSKTGVNRILNPAERSEAYYSDFNALKELAWEEVLDKGTKHFSEEFSRFCDRKMSEIVAMLGWNRAWPELLLQAFFGASKSVWLVHLLANSVHPNLTIFRVGKGARFDPVYMEDMGGDKTKKLIPTVVRIMVTPGFYVYDNVVKCKVLCRYYNTNSNSGSSNYSVFSSGTVVEDHIRRSPLSLP